MSPFPEKEQRLWQRLTFPTKTWRYQHNPEAGGSPGSGTEAFSIAVAALEEFGEMSVLPEVV